MSKTIVAGGDFGNSEATLAWKDGRGVQRETMPSFAGTGDYADLERLRGANEATGTGEDDEITVAGVNYFLGRLAMEQSLDATTARGSASRYYDGHTLRLFLGLAARRLPDDVTVRLMTGVPIHLHSDEMKARIRACFVGQHVYKVRGKPRRLTVEAVAVGIEGGMTLYDVAQEEVDQAVIDIGGGTADAFWAVGRQPVRERCKSYTGGVDKVGDLINQGATRMPEGRELEPKEIDKVLRFYAGQGERPRIYNGSKQLNLNGIGDSAIQTVSAELLRWLGRVWPVDGQGRLAMSAPYVRLIGGGAYYFREAFKARIPHLTIPENPHLANAFAYLQVGLAASEAAWARNRG